MSVKVDLTYWAGFASYGVFFHTVCQKVCHGNYFGHLAKGKRCFLKNCLLSSSHQCVQFLWEQKTFSACTVCAHYTLRVIVFFVSHIIWLVLLTSCWYTRRVLEETFYAEMALCGGNYASCETWNVTRSSKKQVNVLDIGLELG